MILLNGLRGGQTRTTVNRIQDMYALYSVLIVVFFLVMSPYLLYQAVRYRKYIANLPQRLGYLPVSFNLDARRVDLDPRRVGRRSADRARAAAGAARALPAAPDLPRRRRR